MYNIIKIKKRKDVQNMIVKIGTVELFEEEAEKIYQEQKYIVTSTKIYQVHYSRNYGYYGSIVYRAPKGERMTRRGRFFVFDGKEANRLIGFELLR